MMFYISVFVVVALVALLLYTIARQSVEAFTGSSEYDEREKAESKKYLELQFGEQ